MNFIKAIGVALIITGLTLFVVSLVQGWGFWAIVAMPAVAVFGVVVVILGDVKKWLE